MAQFFKANFELIHAIEAAKYTIEKPARLLKGEAPPLPHRFHVDPVYVRGRIPMKREDAWNIRSEFFSLAPHDPLPLLGFLNRYGLWSDEHRGPLVNEDPAKLHHRELTAKEIASVPPWSGSVVEIQPIWEEQEALRRVLPLGAYAWFARGSRYLHFMTTEKPPHLCHVDQCVIEAIYTSITMDYLLGLHFALCPRPDCGKPFVVDHKAKQYCSQYCAHLVSLRRLRASAKVAAKDEGQKKSIRPKKPRTEKSNVHL